MVKTHSVVPSWTKKQAVEFNIIVCVAATLLWNGEWEWRMGIRA